MQCANDSAVVGGRAVPVGRDQARPEKGDGKTCLSYFIPLFFLRLCGRAVSYRIPSQDAKQLIDPMSAAMARPDGAAAPGGPAGQPLSGWCEHGFSAAVPYPVGPGHSSLRPASNSWSQVVPWRGDQRDAAGQRLKRPDRWNARQGRPRKDRRGICTVTVSGEHLRHFEWAASRRTQCRLLLGCSGPLPDTAPRAPSVPQP